MPPRWQASEPTVRLPAAIACHVAVKGLADRGGWGCVASLTSVLVSRAQVIEAANKVSLEFAPVIN